MITTSIGLEFSFDSLSSPLNIALGYQSSDDVLSYAIRYAKNTLDIDYHLTTKMAQASWQSSSSDGLKLSELLTLAGLSELDALADKLDISLKSFTLAYEGHSNFIFLDLVLESGSNAFLAIIKPTTKKAAWQFAFGFYLHDTLSLAELPLVGKELGNLFSIGNIHLAYVSPKMDSSSLQRINQLLSTNKTNDGSTSTVTSKGISAGATFDFGHILPAKNMDIAAPSPAPKKSSSTPAITNSTSASQSTQAPKTATTKSKAASFSYHKEFKLNKSIGPVHIQSMGLGYNNGDLDIDISGGIAVGPLSMNLDGLGVANPLTKFDPSFSLNGLGINFQSGPMSLGGALLKVLPPPEGITYEYDGMINLSLKSFELDAYGSYAKMDNGDTSLFVYAIADYPLGGPAFCFVTGLAAAFGYNRNLIAPDITGVAQYPLVAAAAGNNTLSSPAHPGQDAAAKSTQILTQMDQYLPPMAGEYFVGLGIKFESFKIIDSFALLTAKFGKELAFDFFALSTYKAPDPLDPNPVAVVQLEVLGQFIPSEGSLMVQGQLTPASFLLDKQCHLTGGFAVGLWATGPYAGDFVYSFGGYGSHYTPPSHYPQHIPVIGLSWRINNEISIKGGMYWAITPQIIAAGGYMHATCSASFFRAWFDMDAYFLIQWKPFHYEAGFHVDFGLKVRIDLLFTSIWLGFDIGANLALHGPPFGGTASIDLSVCSIHIHIHFGAQPGPPPALTWTEFESSFLPKVSDRININLVSGLVKSETDIDGNTVWVINPKELCLETRSFIPCTDYELHYEQLGQSKTLAIVDDKPSFNKPAIGPMALAQGAFSAQHRITLTGPDGSCQLKAVAITSNSPKAIWGDHADASDSGSLVSDTLSGFRLEPAAGPKAGITHSVNRNTLAWELDIYPQAFQPQTLTEFNGKQNTRVNQYIVGTDTARKAVLNALNLAHKIPDAKVLEKSLDMNFVPTLITGTFDE